MEKEKSGPTGCFKCGRPGHWSRDCPSSAAAAADINNGNGNPSASGNGKPKKVKAVRKRPKLTPEMLLSEDGLGYVLRHFPRNFKYHGGGGGEASDLGNLIGMYSEWHSRLLPYYSFHHFVHKLEQVAATKRVKLCLGELRDRVARGGDPTSFNQPQPAQDEAPPAVYQEDLLHQTPIPLPTGTVNNNADSAEELHHQTPNGTRNNGSGDNDMTDEQKARMEANRLKALEKAAARARSLQVT